MDKGRMIVIEGACDGVGKTTQLILLRDNLIKDGEVVITHHFPSYGEKSGALVEEYLSGHFGTIQKLSPYFVNSLYAVDRAATWYKFLEKEYEKGNTILLDRYTTSSMIYQSTVFSSIEEKQQFIRYIEDFEYNKNGIPKPDETIFLWAPYDLLAEIRHNRKENDGIYKDIHEQNELFMRKVYDTAMQIADYLSWHKVKCNDGSKMRSIEDIQEEIHQYVKKR